MELQGADFVCPKCQLKYETYEGVCFVNQKSNKLKKENSFDLLKDFFKKSPIFFLFAGFVFGPLLPTFQIRLKKTVSQLRKRYRLRGLNLGSGTSNFGVDILNVDFQQYENVNIVSDINNLPFLNNAFNLVILAEVLEHVESPKDLMAEIQRVLQMGGYLVLTSPFMIGFHASPNDFQRFTIPGLKLLLKDFEILEVRAYGPTGSLLWILQEWFSLWFSFGNKKLHTYLLLLFMLITWPLKIFDLFLCKNSNSENISSTYFILARKK